MSSPQGPRFRAAFSRAALARALAAHETRGLAERFDGRDVIEQRLGTDWVPADVHMAFSEQLRRALGDEGYQEFWRAVMLEVFDGPLLRPAIDSIIRLFGLKPGALAKHAPRFWPLFARGLGELSVERVEADHAALRLTGFPREHFESLTFVVGFAGTLRAYLDLARHEGTSSWELVDVERGAALFTLRWSAR